MALNISPESGILHLRAHNYTAPLAESLEVASAIIYDSELCSFLDLTRLPIRSPSILCNGKEVGREVTVQQAAKEHILVWASVRVMAVEHLLTAMPHIYLHFLSHLRRCQRPLQRIRSLRERVVPTQSQLYQFLSICFLCFIGKLVGN